MLVSNAAAGDEASVLDIDIHSGARIELKPGVSTVVCDDFETGILLREALLEQLTEL